jgi:hypothetical protein
VSNAHPTILLKTIKPSLHSSPNYPNPNPSANYSGAADESPTPKYPAHYQSRESEQK